MVIELNIGSSCFRTVSVLSVFILSLVLAGCSGSSGGNVTSAESGPSAAIDWTGQACESPALLNILGAYRGEFQFSDDSARSCRWNAEVVINGVNEPDTAVCNLFGSVSTTLIEQGTQLEGVPYICAELSQQTEFASGLLEGLDLNVATSSSLILQLDEPTLEFDSNGLLQIHAVTQFESLTIGGGNLISATGTLSR